MKSQVWKRELAVMFSLRAQPLWFRITKWLVFVLVSRTVLRQERRRRLVVWGWFGGVPLAGLALHSVYRWQTKGWTRPWGGWNDLTAGRAAASD